MGTQCCIRHGHLCLLISLPIPHHNEIKLSSLSSQYSSHFLQTSHPNRENRQFQIGMFLSSSYQAYKSPISMVTSPSFPSVTTRMLYVLLSLCYIWFRALGAIFLPLSGILHHWFFLLSSAQPTSPTHNPFNWLFNICKSLSLPQK